MTMSCDDAGTSGVQRFEVFTGAGRQRDWPPEVKAAIVVESYSGAKTVCAVARRHGLCSSQLFTWRREWRTQLADRGLTLPMAQAPAPSFVPVVIESAPLSDPVAPARPKALDRGSFARAKLAAPVAFRGGGPIARDRRRAAAQAMAQFVGRLRLLPIPESAAGAGPTFRHDLAWPLETSRRTASGRVSAPFSNAHASIAASWWGCIRTTTGVPLPVGGGLRRYCKGTVS